MSHLAGILLLVTVLAVVSTVTAPGASQDGPANEQISGSAALPGRVIAAADGRPIRRARVYRIVAIPDAGLSDPTDVTVLEKLRPLAQPVTVIAGETVNIGLRVANLRP